MPILFKTQNKPSSLSGFGVFALEDIPKGSIWWTCDNSVKGVPCLNAPNLDNIVLDQNSFREFESKHSKEEMSTILQYTMHYEDGNQLIYLRDGTGFTNHSSEPNSKIIYNPEKDYKQLKSFAIKDIKAGDEIVQDYGNFIKKTNNWAEGVFQKYVPSRLEFQDDFKIKRIEH